MKFDWYQATIDTTPQIARDCFLSLGHEVIFNDKVGKMYRYQQGAEVHHNERGIVARYAFGGNGGGVHAWATSDDAPAFASLVRAEWASQHTVTRLDTAADFIEPGSYKKLQKKARKIAVSHNLKFPEISDDVNLKAGRTQYVGSPKSDYRARLYEKGYEVISRVSAQHEVKQVLNEETGQFVNPADWTRLELQVRPSEREAKQRLAYATPEQAWTFTSWSAELAKDALSLNLQRFYMRARKYSSDETSLRWMCSQYSNMLLRQREIYGDFACVGLEIERIILEQAKERAR